MYQEFALIYDKLMTDFDYQAYRKYYLEIIEGALVPKGSLLELGAGTGNMTLLLSDDFNFITSIDQSEYMLSVAERKLRNKNNVKLIRADISEYASEMKYDVVIACCDVLNYLNSLELLRRAFYLAYSALNEGGIFLFDLSTIWKLKNILGNETYVEDRENIFYTWRNHYNDKKQSVDMRLDIFVEDGGFYKRILETQTQRGYEAEVVIDCLKKAGFKSARCYNPLTFDTCSENIMRHQFVAIKDL